MKILAIAGTARREAMRQPVYAIVIAGAAILIFSSQYFTFFTFGDEHSMIREMALATILISGLLLAVFGASTVLADEIERKTVLTVLCKPVRRAELLVGKYLGVLSSILLAFVPLAVVFVMTVWWQELELPKEWGWGDVWSRLAVFFTGGPAVLLVKSVVLTYIEVMVLAAVSLMVSTYLPMVVNVVVCSCVFMLGHQLNYILSFFYTADEGGGGLKLLATLIPNLENFNVSSAVAAGLPIPTGYVLAAIAYGLVYTGILLAVAGLIFSRREVG